VTNQVIFSLEELGPLQNPIVIASRSVTDETQSSQSDGSFCGELNEIILHKIFTKW